MKISDRPGLPNPIHIQTEAAERVGSRIERGPADVIGAEEKP